MGRIGMVLALVMTLCGMAQAATWNVVENRHCTGLGDATVAAQATNTAYCCLGAGQGYCDRRENFGGMFERQATMVASGSYVVGGDAFPTAASFGLGTLVYVACEPALANTDPIPAATVDQQFQVSVRRTGVNTFAVQQFLGTTNVEINVASIATRTMSCLVRGF